MGSNGKRDYSYPVVYRIGMEGNSYRPTSKAGEAMGESSVEMVKMPSNFRSGRGVVMEAEMRVRTLFAVNL